VKFCPDARTGGARMRAFNPSLEEHGFQSTHTIVEIVNDDMPFLVESVAIEVNRHGLTLHLIVHPVIAVLRALPLACCGASPPIPSARQRANRSSMSRSTASRMPVSGNASRPTATALYPPASGLSPRLSEADACRCRR